MRRRTLLKNAALLPLVSLCPQLAPALPARALRRVRPGEAAWPTPAQWQELGGAVGGTPIEGQALFSPWAAAPEGAACADVYHNIHNPLFIGDQPGGTQVSGWLDAWTPAPSAYAVRVRHAADVATAVNFARDNNLRLVVKGGAHSYLGTSNAPDSLLIWTRRMRAITLHDAFVAEGCTAAPQHAVSIGPGAIWMQAYEAVMTNGGRYVQGGGCLTVGVAGLVLGGGFGNHSKMFGTAAASLLEAEVVTADGSVRIANNCSHPDLYWALKGGGGGGFGVVTRLTLRTHDLPETIGIVHTEVRAASDA